MCQVETPLEDRGLAEHHVFMAGLQGSLQPPDSLEPHQVDAARGVGEGGREPSSLLFPHRAHGTQHSAQLDLLKVLGQFCDPMEHTTVHITEGIMLEEITEGVDVQVLAQELSPQGADALEEFDRSGKHLLHGAKLGVAHGAEQFHTKVLSQHSRLTNDRIEPCEAAFDEAVGIRIRAGEHLSDQPGVRDPLTGVRQQHGSTLGCSR